MLIADDYHALGWSELENVNENIKFRVNPKNESKMYSSFNKDLITALE